jgi:hypothetical protein
MKKPDALILTSAVLLLGMSCIASAVPGWTWTGGSALTDQFGVYGTKGVPASTNMPGARDRAVCWKDSYGNLWLFGGEGCGATYSGYLNDLWKFDGTKWTWVSGSSTPGQYGVYGTRLVPASTNMPGGRFNAVGWVDSSNNLWLFGGQGWAASGNDSYLNDLWKFDGTNWTWIRGSTATDASGVYGTKGVTTSTSVPGARGASLGWVDSAGNFWLYGGAGMSASTSGYLNDLWKFSGGNWTWMSGSQAASQVGVYGTKNVPAATNIPGARSCPAGWLDSSGNVWLFGGHGYATSAQGSLNDLWKYDGTNWTWVGGSNSVNQVGTYGTQGVAASTNQPGSRYGSAFWKDNTGNFWLFGGSGYPAVSSFSYLGDLWKFDGTNWTWASGLSTANPLPVYGTKNVPSPTNLPGGRVYPMAWKGGNNSLFLFGGLGYGQGGAFGWLSDTWFYGQAVSADINGDGVVNGRDLYILASQWLSAPGTPSADIAPLPAGDGVVNFLDFAVLASHWMQSI